MKDSKIRWTGNTWNFFTGCDKISPGCDRCYAETIAESPRFSGAFPYGFAPTYKPKKLLDVLKYIESDFIFTNSMSDMFHAAFTREQIWHGLDMMLMVDWLVYQTLTKRPQRMVREVKAWMEARGLSVIPQHMWFGVTIESNEYKWRANFLRELPCIRFISAEPLIAPLDQLDLTGIHWLIVGGESGEGFRPMPHERARELLAKAIKSKTAFYFKQSASFYTERGMELDGHRWEQYPQVMTGKIVGRSPGVKEATNAVEVLQGYGCTPLSQRPARVKEIRKKVRAEWPELGKDEPAQVPMVQIEGLNLPRPEARA